MHADSKEGALKGHQRRVQGGTTFIVLVGKSFQLMSTA